MINPVQNKMIILQELVSEEIETMNFAVQTPCFCSHL